MAKQTYTLSFGRDTGWNLTLTKQSMAALLVETVAYMLADVLDKFVLGRGPKALQGPVYTLWNSLLSLAEAGTRNVARVPVTPEVASAISPRFAAEMSSVAVPEQKATVTKIKK